MAHAHNETYWLQHAQQTATHTNCCCLNGMRSARENADVYYSTTYKENYSRTIRCVRRFLSRFLALDLYLRCIKIVYGALFLSFMCACVRVNASSANDIAYVIDTLCRLTLDQSSKVIIKTRYEIYFCHNTLRIRCTVCFLFGKKPFSYKSLKLQ